MLMVTSLNAGLPLNSSGANDASPATPHFGAGSTAVPTTAKSSYDDTVMISGAAQAATSPTSAAESDPYSGLSFSQLQAIHSRVNSELSKGFWASAATNNTQLPNPATPDRIVSAQKATAFLNGAGDNPFKTFARSALTSIIYDESGKYTLNEREAALGQQEINDSAYVTTASNLSSSTGDSRYLANALLQLNQHLSPVEAAVSNELILLTTPRAQLVQSLNEANSTHGGALKSDLPYPGGWSNI